MQSQNGFHNPHEISGYYFFPLAFDGDKTGSENVDANSKHNAKAFLNQLYQKEKPTPLRHGGDVSGMTPPVPRKQAKQPHKQGAEIEKT